MPDVPEQHLRGYLEYLWESCYESATGVVGSESTVELLAGWKGDPGRFAGHLENIGFLDRDEDNRLVCHDFWEHAPDFVRLRKRRSEEKRDALYNRERPTLRREMADYPARPVPSRPVPARPDSEVVGSNQPTEPSPHVGRPIASAMAEEAEVERRLARYTLDPKADEADKATLRRVLAFVSSDRLTGKALPTHKRLKILDTFTRFPTEVVYRACHTFVDDGHLDAARDHAYLAGICDGSATSETIEARRDREKREHHELRETKARAKPTTNPNPIRGAVAAALARAVPREHEALRGGDEAGDRSQDTNAETAGTAPH